MTFDNFALAVAFTTLLLSLLVLLGWQYDITLLKSISSDWPSMKANTAISFLLLSTSLWISSANSEELAPRFHQILSTVRKTALAIVLLIASLTLFEYLSGFNFGIDQMLFDEATGTVGTSHPGRMAPDSSLAFIMLSVACLNLHPRRYGKYRIFSSALATFAAMAIAIVGIISYESTTLSSYGWFGFTNMAMHTALLLLLFSMAICSLLWKASLNNWALNILNTMAFFAGILLLLIVGLSSYIAQSWIEEANLKITANELLISKIQSLLIETIDQ